MDKAASRIMEARQKSERVAIFGDYDADGVTSSAVLYEALSDLGFCDVLCYIPDRQSEGYGMNLQAVNYLHEQGVNLIITVDCGITNHKEIELARSLGMDVILTDHHVVSSGVPKDACCVLNPNVTDSGFRFKELAGVGVAFKLAQALYMKMAPEKKEVLKWALDLVAIGTVADMVPLLGENRVLVKYGLIVLSKSRRKGLLEMFKVGRIDISENKVPDAHKIAFQIAPRVNAAGRMDHASASYKLLIEKSAVLARDLALELEKKNQDRQKITTEIFRQAEILVNNIFKGKKFIFVSNPHWPVGILGLVAGKITDQFKRPSVIFQEREDCFVGSLRSIPEVNIIEMIKKCSDILIGFGGHSQAAGVSVSRENAEEFCERMSGLIEHELEGKEIVTEIGIDCEIGVDDINWEFVAELKKMEPFGMGNEEPVFCARDMVVSDTKIVGNGSKHWKLSLRKFLMLSDSLWSRNFPA
jgi:single-stranded-DNA-specific exonuclease